MTLVGRRLTAEAFRWGRAASGAVQRAMDPPSSWSLRVEAPSKRQVSKNGMHWVFLGCPGVGKGTYASRLASLLSIPHIAMGDLVRQELSQPSEASKKLIYAMSQGKLLPDQVVVSLLSTRLEKGALEGEKGFILDGFPRNTTQAEILEQVTEIDLVVNLKLREDVVISKCLGRRICSQCKGNFNVANIDVEGSDGGPRISMPPLLPPPSCATKMTIRADDTEEVVRERLRIYAEESKPVEDFYRLRGNLFDFEVAGGIPETWPRLLDALNLSEKDCTHQKVSV
ncbi:hypothetical protein O6H91_22G019800 [Diphasiastrum complanatum]|uniref:Uncharacterized protein n=1 Tax=Diphasiastrum complanatum TaxID=34168 RepID=A0ACC2ADQ8_DIPCM|nr:hypothetical protein O6H91_22G019800 [Diphasiastrum complanatum]